MICKRAQNALQSKFVAAFLANRDTPLAATLQRKYFGAIHFCVTITKMIVKSIVARNNFVNVSARMELQTDNHSGVNGSRVAEAESCCLYYRADSVAETDLWEQWRRISH